MQPEMQSEDKGTASLKLLTSPFAINDHAPASMRLRPVVARGITGRTSGIADVALLSLVLIYFTTYVFPFELHIVSWTFPFPDWVKVVLGLALPTSANVAEIFRGAIQSIPSAQWEAAQSLAFRRSQIFRLVVLPQCVRRMLPPWMNLYASITINAGSLFQLRKISP